MFFYWFCYSLAFLPLKIFWPTKVIGKKNLPKKEKAILACNHRSNTDIAVLDINLKRRPYVLAKDSLFKNKFKGAILKSWGAIPVDRQNVGISVIKKVLKLLNENNWLLVFPEGTRKDITDEENMSLKNGTAMFAIKSKSPIVPMWLVKKPKFCHRNVLLIGEKFYLDEFYDKKLNAEVLNEASKVISQKMQELRDDYLKKQQSKGKKIKIKNV